MKITKSQLKQIIKEELENVLNEQGFTMELPFPKKPLPYPSKAYKEKLLQQRPGKREREAAWGGARLDRIRGKALAAAGDDWQDASYDPDAVYRERSFGPKDVEELAKELALQAGLEDRISYNWQDFMDEAKEELMRTGF